MNILYVLNSGKIGGMENHVLNLVEGMVNNGLQVFVWCPDGEISLKYKEKGAKVFDREIRHELDLAYIWTLRRFIKQNKIEVVHAHELKAVSHSLIAGFISGVKVRITHTHTPISTWKINKLKRYLDVKIYSLLVNLLSSKEIALTKSVSERKQKEGIVKGKLVVIPNAVDTISLTLSDQQRVSFREETRKKYSIKSTDVVFGYVGRLSEEKGLEILIQAFNDFLNAEPYNRRSFYLLLAGGGKLEEELFNLAKKLDLEDRVIITGVFSDDDKLKYFSTLDVFVFPTYTEGFGIVLLEAMYLRVPAICSDLEVLKEVGGDTVRYFKTGSSLDLTERMKRVYEEILSGGNLGLDKAKTKVESEYTMQAFVGNYLKLYQGLV